MDIFFASGFELLHIMLPQTFWCMSSGAQMYAVLLTVYLEVEVLNYRVCTSALVDTANQFSRVTVPISTLTRNV